MYSPTDTKGSVERERVVVITGQRGLTLLPPLLGLLRHLHGEVSERQERLEDREMGSRPTPETLLSWSSWERRCV